MKVSKHALASVVALVLAGGSAMAAFSVTEMHTATASAVADFMKNNPAHVAHFTGYKTWKSGDDVKVKVYVAHDGMSMDFNYVCHKHGSNIECHAQ